MPRDIWDDRIEEFDERPVRTTAKAISRGWLIVLLVIALAIGTGIVLWLGRVATSDIKGRGDAEIIKNEARNRIRAQEGFEDKWAAIITADQNLTLTAEQLKAQPDSVKLQTELTGQKMICNDMVGIYNAAARKFTQEEFRAAELPPVIDSTKSETDCKE